MKKDTEENKDMVLRDTLEAAGCKFPTTARPGDPSGEIMDGRWDRCINDPKNAAEKKARAQSANREAMAAFRA
eukprot:7348273-Pyramimonas_sp.AAC.1